MCCKRKKEKKEAVREGKTEGRGTKEKKSRGNTQRRKHRKEKRERMDRDD